MRRSMAGSPAPGCPTANPAWRLESDSDLLSRHLQRRFLAGQGHFFSRKRRLFVNLFRNKRRRLDRLLKRAEFARYLPERLLLVGPVQGGVVEAVHDGGFDD